MIEPQKRHIDYFYNVFNSYIEKLEEKDHIKKIFIVTFPHKKHFRLKADEKILYQLNVSNIIKKKLENRKDITHINFSEILVENNNFDYKNVWKDDDIHLKNKIHADIFVKRILEELNDFLKFSE